MKSESEDDLKLDLAMELETPVDSAGTAELWRKALKKVVPAVVVLRITTTRTFDTEVAGATHATGFVVDKQRGIILTNRHVVKPGPVVAEAMFVNREEILVYPLYRDPVHDFGFFWYDPRTIQFLDYEEIPLAPDAAAVGLEIRVVGNDSGEKVSILAGTLARLDRDAPHYKSTGYNDFNTFYMQAASGTKRGSSGSPVIDIYGQAVALNAGSRSSSASAFFLPLERVVRALHLLQEQKDMSLKGWTPAVISRGTLQLTFSHKGFHEIRRLGLKRDTEEMVRKASPSSETGMLVVDSVVPEGPAHKQLEPGDVLVSAEGEILTQFLKYETLLDDNVGKLITLKLDRGGTTINVTIEVQDLHSITPNMFLEVSGGVLHALSYQQARNLHFVCGIVYVAEPGYMLSCAGVPRHAIIKKMAGEEIDNLDKFISVFFKLSRGARVPLEFISHSDRHRIKSVLITIDRHEWYAPPRIYIRNDAFGLWDIYPAASKSEVALMALKADPMKAEADAVSAVNGTVKKGDNGEIAVKDESQVEAVKMGHKFKNEIFCDLPDPTIKGTLGSTSRQESGNAPVNSSSVAEYVIEPTLVMVEVHIPPLAMHDGVHLHHFSGTGVIVHHSKDLGLVAVDKNTVVISVSDVMLNFAAFPMEIPAEVVFLHPVHNYALVAYTPIALGEVGMAAVQAAVLSPDPPLRRGDFVYLVGLSRSLQATSRKSTVTNSTTALHVPATDIPRYRAMNMEVIELDIDLGHTFSGVLADEAGRVQALWGNFSAQAKYGNGTLQDYKIVRGIPIRAISEVLDVIVSGTSGGSSLLINGVKRSMPLIRVLEAELYPTLLSKARIFGLSDKWMQTLVERDNIRRQVLRVKGCLAGSRAFGVLEQGDMLLAINGQPVTCFRDVEISCEATKTGDSDALSPGTLDVTLFRQGQEINVKVGIDDRHGLGTTRMINWAGCILQEPHSAVRALGFFPEEGHGVYVAGYCHGSPAHRYRLHALRWIVEVNGKPTPTLQVFVDVTQELEHGAFVRVKTVNLNGKPRVLTVKQDLHYWPTWELRLDPATALWSRHNIKTHSN